MAACKLRDLLRLQFLDSYLDVLHRLSKERTPNRRNILAGAPCLRWLFDSSRLVTQNAGIERSMNQNKLAAVQIRPHHVFHSLRQGGLCLFLLPQFTQVNPERLFLTAGGVTSQHREGDTFQQA